MIRILHCVNNMHRAGIETMLMNYYRNIDRSKIQFDFLTHRPQKADYDDEILSMGGRVYYAPRLIPNNYPAYFRFMKRLFEEHQEYKIVHSHIDSMSYLPLLASKKEDIPVRIAHSHITSIDPDYKFFLKQYFRYKIREVATDYLACGEEAGKYMFGEKEFEIVPNAIDPSFFRFDIGVRNKMRRELQFGDAFIVGAVGRFSRQKNFSFLIRVFEELCRKQINCFLLLVGDGEEAPRLYAQALTSSVSYRIRFIGIRSDMEKLYQIMDVLVMPSLYEGLPLVGIEAQAAGLPCVFSSKITKEVKLTEKVCFMDLKEPISMWADRIWQMGNTGGLRETDIADSGYDVRSVGESLTQYYMKKLKEL